MGSEMCIRELVALLGFHMPIAIAGSSASYGAAFGLFPISWIVFWTIALYKGFDV